MAGPTCSVLLRSRLDPNSRDQLNTVLNNAGWKDVEPLFVEVSPVDSGSDPYQEPDLRQLEDGFGWRPVEQVACISMVGSDPSFHRLLAQGAVAVARAFGGVIDLGGQLPEPLDGNGTRVSVSYETYLGDRSEYWVVDVIWLESWMSHSAFRMVK